MTLNNYPELYTLAESSKVEYPMNCLFERATGLHDKIMQARFRCIDRNPYHDLLEADSSVTLAKADIRETPTIGQEVQLQPGRRIPAVLEKANEVIGVQGRLAAGGVPEQLEVHSSVFLAFSKTGLRERQRENQVTDRRCFLADSETKGLVNDLSADSVLERALVKSGMAREQRADVIRGGCPDVHRHLIVNNQPMHAW